MFLRGKDMEAEGSKILNISDRFVDHEAVFSLDVNKDLLAELERREQQYRLMTHPAGRKTGKWNPSPPTSRQP